MPDSCSIGVRQLRENLSATLKRVRDGETLRVTDRGHPVALLSPLPDVTDPIERLIAAGRLRPPESSEPEVPRPRLRNRSGATSDEILDDLRRDLDE